MVNRVGTASAEFSTPVLVVNVAYDEITHYSDSESLSKRPGNGLANETNVFGDIKMGEILS